jgi:hypothetical protein
LDTNGNFVWVKQMGGTVGAGTGTIDLDATGKI